MPGAARTRHFPGTNGFGIRHARLGDELGGDGDGEGFGVVVVGGGVECVVGGGVVCVVRVAGGLVLVPGGGAAAVVDGGAVLDCEACVGFVECDDEDEDGGTLLC